MHDTPRDQRTSKWVFEQVKAHDVKFIEVWFTDILGTIKSMTIPISELQPAFDEGIGFDGSSIHGFTRIDESDMNAWPDPTTFALVPWKEGTNRVARMIGDIKNPDGTPFEGAPRLILKKAVERAKKMGFTNFYVGPELEYFYIKGPTDPTPLDDAGYFDLSIRDEATNLRLQTMEYLEKMGIPAEYAHHEVAPSQHEIDLRYADAVTMADCVITHKIVVKEVAAQNGVYATFMPKPINGVNGSGMHTHQSLFVGDKNAFYDPKDKWHLSDLCKKYIAGLLKYGPEISVVTSPSVNSYKRLVPGYEAPVYLTWALRNRSDLIRVPGYKPGKEKATRIEYRAPDPACNPYMAFATMLHAGLEGIEKNLVPPAPTESNVYEMSDAERTERGIGSLPGSLIEAIQLAERSDLVKKSLGEHTFKRFIESKRLEWDRFRTHVTKFEIETYLPVL